MAATSAPAPTPGTSASAPTDPTLAKAQSILAPGTGGTQNYGPGQNPFTAAANNVDVQKAAMLSAIAQGGSAGRAVLDAANNAEQDQRLQAIQGALAGSAVRGANPGMQASIASTVGAPGQEYGADLSAAGKSFTEGNAALDRGFSNYATMAKEAVPVLQAKTDQFLAAKRSDTMAKLATQWQDAQYKSALAAQNAQDNQTLKGLEEQTAQANRDAAQARAGAAAGKANGGAGTDNPNAVGLSGNAATLGGIDTGTAAKGLGYSTSKIAELEGLDGGQSFAAGKAAFEAGLAGGESIDQVTANVQNAFQAKFGNRHPEMVQLLTAMYGPAYQNVAKLHDPNMTGAW